MVLWLFFLERGSIVSICSLILFPTGENITHQLKINIFDHPVIHRETLLIPIHFKHTSCVSGHSPHLCHKLAIHFLSKLKIVKG